MNNRARMLLQKRIMDKRRDRRDYADSRDYADRRDYNDYGDMRRGRRDRNEYNDYNDYNDYARMRDRNDYNDYGDYNDGHNIYKLQKEDLHEWSEHLDNKDGSKGPHFNEAQMKSAAERIGIKFRDYDEHEFCMTANMLYSDLCMDLRHVITPEKEAIEYAKMARSWLEDSDASAKNSEKLAAYYYLIVKK